VARLLGEPPPPRIAPALGSGAAREIGTINTYQSLTPDAVDTHRRMAQVGDTLVIFDEVHHLGEPEGNGQRPAWARAAMQFVGEIGGLQVAGVLNLSGTLWRSSRSERISSVRYEEIETGVSSPWWT